MSTGREMEREGKSKHQGPTPGRRVAMRYRGRGDTRYLRFFASLVTLSRLFDPVGPQFSNLYNREELLLLPPSLGWTNVSESGWCVQAAVVLEERLLLGDWHSGHISGLRLPSPRCERPGVHSPSVLTAGLTHALSGARAGSVLKS